MSYLWECKVCKATQWGKMIDGDDLDPDDWDEPNEPSSLWWHDGETDCEHEEFEMIDSEWDEIGDEVI